MASRSCSLMLLLALLGALAPASRVSAEDAACAALFEQAAAQLAAEQYPRMLRVANDRMREESRHDSMPADRNGRCNGHHRKSVDEPWCIGHQAEDGDRVERCCLRRQKADQDAFNKQSFLKFGG